MAGAQQCVRDDQASATPFCRLTAQRQGLRMARSGSTRCMGRSRSRTVCCPRSCSGGLDGDLPPLVDPDVARDYVHVDDMCEAYRLAAASHLAPEPGSVYNVGTGIQTKLREVVDVARRALPIAVEPRWGSMPRRGWDTGVWLSDSRRIRAELGWHPASSL